MAGNPNWSSVALQMHFDALRSGKALDSSLKLLDASLYGTAALSSTRSLFGGKSLHTDGSNTSYAEVPSDTALCPTGIPWTLEVAFFAEVLSSGSKTIISKRGGGANEWMLFVDGAASKVLRFFAWSSAGATCVNIATTTQIATGNWYRGAVVRDSAGLWSLFLEGHLEASATESAQVGTGTSIVGLGRDSRENATTSPGSTPVYPERNWNGYLEELRITSGVCLYTADYTVASSPFADGLGEVAGVVTDESGNPAARLVRGYRRDTGDKVAEVTSDGTTGAYRFYTQTLDEINRIVYDDATSGTIYNDIIDRVIPE